MIGRMGLDLLDSLRTGRRLTAEDLSMELGADVALIRAGLSRLAREDLVARLGSGGFMRGRPSTEWVITSAGRERLSAEIKAGAVPGVKWVRKLTRKKKRGTMKVIALGKGQGKTRQALELCASEQLHLVTISMREVHRVLEVAQEMGLSIPTPMTFDEFLRRDRWTGKHINGFVIDNADHLLQRLAMGTPLAAITVDSPGLDRLSQILGTHVTPGEDD